MKRWNIVLSLVVVIILPAALSAAEVRGVISAVDLKKGELVLDKVKPRTADTTYALTDKTTVLYGKVPATLKDLPTGRHVNIEVEENEGKRIVTRILVHGPKPVAAKATVDVSTVSGTLRRVALTDREIVVVGPGAKGAETETTIAVPETARVLRDGKALPFEELKEGEGVTVNVEKLDGRLSAKTVQVGMAAPATKESSTVVPRLRLLLRLADGLLRQMEDRK